jgi:hypothetical protein
MGEDSKLVLLARFYDPSLAMIAKSVLESHDIPCFVFDADHTIQPWLSNTGARLMVLSDDREAAKAILIDEDVKFE